MIRVHGLTKTYGKVVAVDDLSFDVDPGRVTGFLGPNGAGKSTTLRVMTGLDRPTAGEALIGGHPYRRIRQPLREVGALLDAEAMHPGRTGRAHLRIAARSNGLPGARVDEVIEQVGLGEASRRRIKGYSLGMRQRLGIASALLGDPGVLVFDEPVNGLDIDGVMWIRSLMHGLAAEGRTVLVSSHLMSELQQIADHIVIIGRGRLLADAPLGELLSSLGVRRVRVQTQAPEPLIVALRQRAVEFIRTGAEEVEIVGLDASEVGALTHRLNLPVRHLSQVHHSLEDAYLRLTEDAVEFHGDDAPSTDTRGARS
ncbi:ABC transporter ATP-binding protein [Micromonospora sp. DT81.3]|uniref:ABC transporter ATP-binding protein n=1 Tax=Micromonospora sp. DT81.3 TaxID=3416523 RepID=UPI003CE6931A